MPRGLSCALVLALVLLAPTAMAWEAHLTADPAEVSLADSLLLAGALRGNADNETVFGAPFADRLLFDEPVTVRYCPDRAGEPEASEGCAQGFTSTGARLYIHAGGLVVRAQGPTTLVAPATAAALGGPNVTLNGVPVGPAVYVGGEATVRASTDVLIIRPLGSIASLEVRGNEGFRTYNGSAFTLLVSGVGEAALEARGAFLGSAGVSVELDRAGIERAERDLRVDELFTTLRALQPPERADRRAALAGAFGLFQLVPGLLDGAAAGRANLTLNGEPREELTFVRLASGRFVYDEGAWTGGGDATYMLDGELLRPRPAAGVRFPIVIPVLLVAAAIGARASTPRSPARRSVRLAVGGIRIAGVLVLAIVAAATLTPLFGFSPVLDLPALSVRSRVQLLLLVTGIVASAYVAIGFPSESLARSVYAWRDRPRALLVPAFVGLAAALVFILLATPILLSFVARFVRL